MIPYTFCQEACTVIPGAPGNTHIVQGMVCESIKSIKLKGPPIYCLLAGLSMGRGGVRGVVWTLNGIAQLSLPTNNFAELFLHL